MKRHLSVLVLGVLGLCLALTDPVLAKGREKVILDTDMVELFDDGAAMIMLARAENVELLGVTTVSGNSWATEGSVFGMRQLAIIGRTDIPVVNGVEWPLRPGRYENLAAERTLMGMGHDGWVGAFGHEPPASFEAFYEKTYGTKPPAKLANQDAVTFIIEQVRKNPGEITIAAIGPCTNLALAIRQAPDIIPLIKRVIYMGGAFYQPGNVTPAAEFNWWFDPEAARMTVRAPFREQIMVGLDVCEKVHFDKALYDRFLAADLYPDIAAMFKDHYAAKFEKNPKHTSFVWDLIVSAIIINPAIITGEKEAKVDINADLGLSYGQSLAYPVERGPGGAQKARIVMDIDQKVFWDLAVSGLTRPAEGKAKK